MQITAIDFGPPDPTLFEQPVLLPRFTVTEG
jgi:hypothetical protein